MEHIGAYLGVLFLDFIVVINDSFFNRLCSRNTTIFTELQQDLQAAMEMSKSLQMIVSWKKDFKVFSSCYLK